MRKKILFSIILILLLIIIILWANGLIPKYIAKSIAIQYSNKYTPGFSYSFMEYREDVVTGYLIYLKKDNGDFIVIKVNSKYFPFSVEYSKPNYNLPGPVINATTYTDSGVDIVIYHSTNEN